MAYIVEIANQRNINTLPGQRVTNMRYSSRSFFTIHGNTNDFRSRLGELGNLFCRRNDISRIGVGHRLHDDREITPNSDISDFNRHAFAALNTVNPFRHCSIRLNQNYAVIDVGMMTSISSPYIAGMKQKR